MTNEEIKARLKECMCREQHGSVDQCPFAEVCAVDEAALNRIEALEREHERLIAAAPEMLEALKLVLEVGLADEYGAVAAEDTIRAAIAKAEGR